MRKIIPIFLLLFLTGCAGMYIEKHLLITGTNIKCVYGSGNLTVVRDVYFGRISQNLTAPSFGVSNTTEFKNN